MNSARTVSIPSSQNLEVQSFTEPASIVDFPTAFKAIKKDLRHKRYRRAYQFLQQHRPVAEQHLLLYYEASLQSVARVVRAGNLKKQGHADQLNNYCEKALIMAKRLVEQMSCQEQVLVGKKAVRPGIGRKIDRLWCVMLDLSTDLAIGYKIAGKYKDALRCFYGGERLADELLDSLTRNTTILGKIVKLKMQLGTFHLELGLGLKAVGFIEQALEIGKNELAIRQHIKSIKRGEAQKSPAQQTIERKHQKADYHCKKIILILTVLLALSYESLGLFDVVAFLVIQAKAMVDEFGMEKNDGITKTLEKLESQQFLWRFEKYAAALEQLGGYAHQLFDVSQLMKITQQKKQSKAEKKLRLIKGEQSLVGSGKKLATHKTLKSNSAVPDSPMRTPFLLSPGKVGQFLGIGQVQSQVIDENSSMLIPPEEKDCVIQPAVVVPKKSVVIVEPGSDQPRKSSATIQTLVNELLCEATSVEKKRFHRTHGQGKSKRAHSVTGFLRSLDQTNCIGNERTIPINTPAALGEDQVYVNAFIGTLNRKTRFKSYDQVQTQLRSMSTKLHKFDKATDYEKTRLQSRGRPRTALLNSSNLLTSQEVHPNFKTANNKRLKHGTVPLSSTHIPFSEESLGVSTKKSIGVAKSNFQRPSTNIQFQQTILKHKEMFKLNKLEAHCLKNRQCKQQRLRRNGRKVSFQRNAEMYEKLSYQSQARIQQLLDELMLQKPSEDDTRKEESGQQGLQALRKTSKLLLSYHYEPKLSR